MKWRGLWGWISVGLVLAGGVGFLIGAVATSAAADTYRAAPPCGTSDQSSANCYRLVSGTLTSVHATYSRSGERDDVTIETAAGTLTTTLEPSDASAPHVRSGAQAEVKSYQGQVTTVYVDGLSVPSSVNPEANHGSLLFYGVSITALGLAFLGFRVYALRKRRNASSTMSALSGEIPWAAGATIAPAPPPSSLQPQVVPGGQIGHAVRPHFRTNMIWRFAFVGGALLLLTFRGLFYPNVAQWVALFDAVVVLLGAAALYLYLTYAEIFSDSNALGQVTFLGRVKRFPRSRIDHAVRFTVSSRYGNNPYLAFVDQTGAQVFKVSGMYWDQGELDAFCASAGISTTGSYQDVISALQMNKRVRGSANWLQAVVIVVVFVAVLVPVLILLQGPTNR